MVERELGSDWNWETELHTMLHEINQAAAGKLQSQGYNRQKITLTLAASTIDLLKEKVYPLCPDGPITYWSYLLANNVLAMASYELEILPHYVLVDVGITLSKETGEAIKVIQDSLPAKDWSHLHTVDLATKDVEDAQAQAKAAQESAHNTAMALQPFNQIRKLHDEGKVGDQVVHEGRTWVKTGDGIGDILMVDPESQCPHGWAMRRFCQECRLADVNAQTEAEAQQTTIKRWSYEAYGYNMIEWPTGEYVRIEDHALAVAEAYAKGVESAGAPELLEALKECAEVACAETCDHVTQRTPAHTPECISARKVIAKAEGK